MTTYGARSYSALPLELRTATLLQPATPYAFGPEIPVSSNRLLMTRGGILSPQDAVSLSSLMTSTLSASTATLSTTTTDRIQTTALSASTAVVGLMTASTVNVSTLAGTTLLVNSTLTAPSITTTLLNCSTITGDLGSAVTLSTLTVNQKFTALNMPIALSTVTAVAAKGAPTTTFLSSLTLSSVALSSLTLSTSEGSTATLATQGLSTSMISASTLWFASAIGTSLTVNGVSLTSTFTASSLLTQNTTYYWLSTTYLSTTVISTAQLIGSTLFGSAATFSTLQTPTLTTGSLLYNNLSSIVSSITASIAFTGSTMVASSISLGAVYGSTILVSSVLTASSMAVMGSTLVSSVSVTTLAAVTIGASSLTLSSLTASTVSLATFRTLAAGFTTLTGSTVTFSPVDVGATVNTSTVASSVSLTQLTASSISTSALAASTLNGSTMTTGTLSNILFTLSSLSSGTVGTPSLWTSTLNAMTVWGDTSAIIGRGAVPFMTPANLWITALGASTLSATQGLSTTTIAGYQAAAALPLASTIVAVGAFSASGSAPIIGGVYLGASTTATASQEAVLGAGGVGGGTGTITLGTVSTLTTRLYGSVGIGTTAPLAALDVRGLTTVSTVSTVYNTTTLLNHSAVLSVYANQAQGGSLFLNDGLSVIEGGSSAGTLRCDVGALRIVGLSGSGGSAGANAGLWISAAGLVGVGTSQPTVGLDVRGYLRCQADAAWQQTEGGNNAVTACSPLLSAYLWMGYDPATDVGFLNAGQSTNLIWPIVLQPAGGSVGVGVTAPVALLDVAGTARFGSIQTGSLAVGSATVGGVALVSGSQWTGAVGGPISYTGAVSVGGTVQANTYVGLPTATASSAGLIQTGAGLVADAGGVTTVALPFVSCRCTGSTTGWGGGGYVVGLTAVYQNGCTVSGVGAVQVSVAGQYMVTVSGSESADTLKVWKNSGAIGTVVTTGAVWGEFYVALTTSDVITVTSQQTTGLDGLCVVVHFLSM